MIFFFFGWFFRLFLPDRFLVFPDTYNKLLPVFLRSLSFFRRSLFYVPPSYGADLVSRDILIKRIPL